MKNFYLPSLLLGRIHHSFLHYAQTCVYLICWRNLHTQIADNHRLTPLPFFDLHATLSEPRSLYQSPLRMLAYTTYIDNCKLLVFISSCNKWNRNAIFLSKLCSLDFRSTYLSHLTILLLLSGQVENNPGPSTGAPETFPCAICGEEVRHIICSEAVSDNDQDQELCLAVLPVFLYQHRSLQGLYTPFAVESFLNPSPRLQWWRNSSLHQTSNLYADIETLGRCQRRFYPPSRNRKRSFKVMVSNCNGLRGCQEIKLPCSYCWSHPWLCILLWIKTGW